ncbi:MAG: hypothetical protein JXR03_18505 [Cyclobacteriaceae bacterium]
MEETDKSGINKEEKEDLNEVMPIPALGYVTNKEYREESTVYQPSEEEIEKEEEWRLKEEAFLLEEKLTSKEQLDAIRNRALNIAKSSFRKLKPNTKDRDMEK